MTAKKLLASVLVLLMLIGLVPMAAFAAEDHTVQLVVDTSALGELNPGDVIQVPVKATVNDGFAGLGLVVDYSDEVFEKNGANLITPGEDLPAVASGDVVLYENADAENVTILGTMFYINLKVKEDAPAGSTTISIAVNDNDPDNNFFSVCTKAQIPKKFIKVECNDKNKRIKYS